MTHQAHTVREYSTETRPDIESEAAMVRERYGKADLVASVLGMFAALGTLVFLTALFAAGAANVEPQINLLNQDGTLSEVETVGAIAAGRPLVRLVPRGRHRRRAHVTLRRGNERVGNRPLVPSLGDRVRRTRCLGRRGVQRLRVGRPAQLGGTGRCGRDHDGGDHRCRRSQWWSPCSVGISAGASATPTTAKSMRRWSTKRDGDQPSPTTDPSTPEVSHVYQHRRPDPADPHPHIDLLIRY